MAYVAGKPLRKLILLQAALNRRCDTFLRDRRLSQLGIPTLTELRNRPTFPKPDRRAIQVVCPAGGTYAESCWHLPECATCLHNEGCDMDDREEVAEFHYRETFGHDRPEPESLLDPETEFELKVMREHGYQDNFEYSY